MSWYVDRNKHMRNIVKKYNLFSWDIAYLQWGEWLQVVESTGKGLLDMLKVLLIFLNHWCTIEQIILPHSTALLANVVNYDPMWVDIRLLDGWNWSVNENSPLPPRFGEWIWVAEGSELENRKPLKEL